MYWGDPCTPGPASVGWDQMTCWVLIRQTDCFQAFIAVQVVQVLTASALRRREAEEGTVRSQARKAVMPWGKKKQGTHTHVVLGYSYLISALVFCLDLRVERQWPTGVLASRVRWGFTGVQSSWLQSQQRAVSLGSSSSPSSWFLLLTPPGQ